MSLKAFLTKVYAAYIHRNNNRWKLNPLDAQQKVFQQLLKKGSETMFGKDHGFDKIKTYQDFANQVPIRDYEGISSYIEYILEGREDVLWPGIPLYLAKTSGTTSGVKYIPLTKDSMPYHVQGARDAILAYVHETGKSDFVDGKMIFLQGSPILEQKGNLKYGRLSGISAHYVPNYLQKNRLPSWKTNCIEDWETKVDAIVKETEKEDMRMISGIPSWVQMYFEKLVSVHQKPVGELFKNFSLFIYGGVNFEPYRNKFEKLIQKKVDAIELYPASEGFFAYQDSQVEKGLLLLVDAGIFYEFVRVDEFYTTSFHRHPLETVEVGINYVMIVSTNAGLWGYNIGDTVMFVSTSPYRIVVTGRIKHYISAFGEHVIGKEVEAAMHSAIQRYDLAITEFTVAPQINPEEGLPYHEWFVEFEKTPTDLEEFSLYLDQALRKQNVYYDDLIAGRVLRTAVVRVVAKGGFQEYMKSIGKLGGQNKLPRLANDREIVDKLPLL